MQSHTWVNIIIKPPDVCEGVSYLLEGHFTLQRNLLLSGVGCVNGWTILSTLVIVLLHTCIKHTYTHTHKGKIRHPTKMHEAPQSEQTQCDLHVKGFHNYVIILRLEFMRPNEFKVHSRFRLSLGRPESCRCMGKWRWTHFPLLCHLCDSVKNFHQLYVRVFGRISRSTVTWLGGQTAAILSMLFKC